MANINVNRNVTDTFYRYKMPKLIAKVNGIWFLTSGILKLSFISST